MNDGVGVQRRDRAQVDQLYGDALLIESFGCLLHPCRISSVATTVTSVPGRTISALPIGGAPFERLPEIPYSAFLMLGNAERVLPSPAGQADPAKRLVGTPATPGLATNTAPASGSS